MQLDRSVFSSFPIVLLLATACRTPIERDVSVARVSAAPAETAGPAAPVADEVASFELAFGTHLDMDLPEQDVYLEREPGSAEVWRVTVGDNDMNAPLYKTAIEVRHDPFDPAALGPYPKGEPLGMTLGQWLRHSGRGRYTYADGVGKLELTFNGLVPNGVYTLWHAFIALPPTTPFSGTLDLPLGARDGSESAFKADAQGHAEIVRTFSPGLEMSDVYTTSMLAIAFHSDGETHGGVPGAFGRVTHVPLFVMLPKREGIR